MQAPTQCYWISVVPEEFDAGRDRLSHFNEPQRSSLRTFTVRFLGSELWSRLRTCDNGFVGRLPFRLLNIERRRAVLAGIFLWVVFGASTGAWSCFGRSLPLKRGKACMDDRLQFAEERRAQALALGKDDEIFSKSLALVGALNKYDYSYLWTWAGLPIIQMPADVLATQEVIWNTKPDVIVETGVARGGSLLFLASMLRMLGEGTVIGIDIDVREHNRDAILSHPLASSIRLVDGSSTDPKTISNVRDLIPENSRVMVILDSDHSRDHVLAECRMLGDLVTTGCYLVVADTLVGHISKEDAPVNRAAHWYRGNDPLSGLQAFMQECSDFETDDVLNGKLIMSSSPGGYVRRVRGGRS